MPRPSDHLAAQVFALLRCAAPDAVGSVTDIVVKAYDDRLSDGEVLNMLCDRYQVGRDGWPLDPLQRAIARVKHFFATNDPKNETRLTVMLKQCTATNESDLMEILFADYGKNEHGEPTDPDAYVAWELRYIFTRCAPDQLGLIDNYVKQFCDAGEMRNPHTFLDRICSTFGVGRDGWPGHPKTRRRARITRFFLTNKPEDLRKVDSLVAMKMSEAELMAELYSLYGKNEIGEPVRAVAQLRNRLKAILEVAAPEKLAALSTIVAYGERNNLSDDQVIHLVTEQLNVGEDGWPSDPVKRLRTRVERFFITNAPNDLGKADRLLGLSGVNEDEIMQQLYKKYGFDEFGREVNLKVLEDELEDRVAEFYEQYVPEEEVVALTKQALGLKLPQAELFALLEQRYKGLKPVPSEVRKQIQTIFRRAGEKQWEAQTRSIMLVKRRENLSDKDLISAVCDRFGVNSDGWPTDATARRTKRLTMFFQNNDPSRLNEVKSLVKSIGESTKAETAFFERLIKQYSRDELGDDAKTVEASATQSVVGSGAAGHLEDDDDYASLHPASAVADFDLTVNNITRAYVPGMSQVWPPPDLTSAEALYRSELFSQLLRKYGGTSVSFEDHSDSFSRLARRFDADGVVDDEGLHFQPHQASPKEPLHSKTRQAAVSEAELFKMYEHGSMASRSLQHSALPNKSNAIQDLNRLATDVIKDCTADRQRAADRIRRQRSQLGADVFTLNADEYAPNPGTTPSRPAMAATPATAPRATYRVNVPDVAGNVSVLPREAVSAVVQRAALTAFERLPSHLRPPSPPKWIADEERLYDHYPLWSLGEKKAQELRDAKPYGTRPRKGDHRS